MKTKKGSRILALLLSLVMLLGTLPTAFAEGDGGAIVSNMSYDEALDAVVQMYYEQLAACETYEEMLFLFEHRDWDQFDAFVNRLGEEDKSVFLLDMEALHDDFVERTSKPIMIAPVNYTNAAGFLPPVSGAASAARFSLLRTGTAARTATDTNGNGLFTDKQVRASTTGEKGQYILTLEAYATGSQVIDTVETDVPTDIILVLDQSGSMADCIRCGNSVSGKCTHYSGTATAVYNVPNQSTNTAYYYQSSETTYGRVYYCGGSSNYGCTAGWYTESHSNGYNASHGGAKVTPKTSADGEGTQFYTLRNANTVNHVSGDSRLNALKTAVTNFAAAVADKAKGADKNSTDDDIDHTISVVGFASGSYYNYNNYNYGNTEVFVGGTGYKYGASASAQYKNVPQDMSTTTGVNNVTASINALDDDGGTIINLGMEMAAGILEANPVPANEKRNRVVVVFTDGVPGWSGYDSSVASSAITESSTIKTTYGATVYTVGVFAGADATSAGNSNGTETQKANYFMQRLSSNTQYPQSPSYYLSAGDATTLNNIFQQISQNIEDSVNVIPLDATTVVKDILTDQFVLPEGVTANSGDIKVYTADYTAENTFGDRTAFSATPVIEGNSISVNGFDFATNWVGYDEIKEKYRGKKLIIEIPIEVRDGFLGGNDVLTNAEGSGIYQAGSETPFESFEDEPTVNVEIKDITITAQDKNVYLLNDLTSAQILNGTVIKSGDVVIDPTEENFGLEEWQYAYVTVGSANDGGSLNDLTADGSFKVSCAITPDTDGSTTTVGTVASEKSKEVTGNFYVYKPVLTFKDSQEKYLSTMEESTAADYFKVNNNVSEVWKHGNTEASNMTGEKPTLVLTYTPANGPFDSAMKVTSQSDVPVNVTVKIGDTPVDSYTASIRETCTCDKLNCSTCGFKNDDKTAYPILDNNPEFIVHVYDVYGKLEITKTVKQEEFESGSFTFTVTGPNNYSKTVTIELKDGATTGSTTIEDLLPGTYTVTETTTDNYDVEISVNNSAAVEAVETEVKVEANQTAYVGVENTANIDYDVTVTKVWVDNNNTLKYRPDTITLTLKGDEGASYTETKTFTVDKTTNTATYTFEDVPMYDNDGNIIEYSVVEAAIDKYDTTYNGLTVTNSVNVGHLQINKTVKQSDFTGGTFTFSVTGPNGYTGTASIVLDGNNKTGSTVIRDLLPGTYTVTETSTEGYSVNYAPQTVTVVVGQTVEAGVENTADVDYDVTVTKVWNDKNNNLGYRPETITLSLTGNGQTYTQEFAVDQSKTEDASTAEYTFNVPKYDENGNEITYTVDEPTVPKYYKKSISGKTVTNSIDLGHLKIGKAAIKEENNEDNIDTLPNMDFEFDLVLTFGNKELTDQPMTKYDASGNVIETGWIGHGSVLKLKAGEYVIIAVEPQSATFRVTERNKAYFTNDKTGSTFGGEIMAGDELSVNFTNIYHKRKTGDLTITKNLVDASFVEGTRTFNFNVKLNDADTFAQQQFGEWAEAMGLTVTETSEEVDGKTVTKKSATVPITVDASDKEVSMTLTEVTLDKQKGDLPAGTYGLPVGEYIVTEAAQTAYYQSTTSVPENGTVTVMANGTAAVTVTNTADLYNEIKVTKYWVDQSNASGQRPADIVVTLNGSDGTSYPLTLTGTGDSWTGKWENIPKKTLKGEAITYTVSEQPVTNYEDPVYGGNVESDFTVTNTIKRTSLTITKQGAQAEDEIFIMKVQTESAGLMEVVIVGNGSVTINNLMVGEEVTVTEDMNWAWRYNAAYAPAQTLTLKETGNQVTVTNKIKTNEWIDGNTSAENIFGSTPTKVPSASQNNK